LLAWLQRYVILANGQRAWRGLIWPVLLSTTYTLQPDEQGSGVRWRGHVASSAARACLRDVHQTGTACSVSLPGSSASFGASLKCPSPCFGPAGTACPYRFMHMAPLPDIAACLLLCAGAPACTVMLHRCTVLPSIAGRPHCAALLPHCTGDLTVHYMAANSIAVLLYRGCNLEMQACCSLPTCCMNALTACTVA
jgi:hypothetical protein